MNTQHPYRVSFSGHHYDVPEAEAIEKIVAAAKKLPALPFNDKYFTVPIPRFRFSPEESMPADFAFGPCVKFELGITDLENYLTRADFSFTSPVYIKGDKMMRWFFHSFEVH